MTEVSQNKRIVCSNCNEELDSLVVETTTKITKISEFKIINVEDGKIRVASDDDLMVVDEDEDDSEDDIKCPKCGESIYLDEIPNVEFYTKKDETTYVERPIKDFYTNYKSNNWKPPSDDPDFD